MYIGDRIKALREEKGMTQQAVADVLHIKRESINSWENGLRDMKTGAIIALADFFDVSADYLLGRTTYRSVDIDTQGICQKTGLWEDAVQRLVMLNKCDKRAISDCIDEQGDAPTWMYEAFSSAINCFILGECTPFLAANAYHAAENIEKSKDVDVSLIIKAQEVSSLIDPDLLVLAPREAVAFFRQAAEKYATEMLDCFIEAMRELVTEDQNDGKA